MSASSKRSHSSKKGAARKKARNARNARNAGRALSARNAATAGQAGQAQATSLERGPTWRQRLLPSILLALTAPLTVFVFGPIDLLQRNDELLFRARDFLPFCALFALLAAAALAAVLVPLRGRAFDIVCAVVFWLSAMLFLQGHYLNIGLVSLIGDGLSGSRIPLPRLIVNTGIWLIVGNACVLTAALLPKRSGTLRTIMVIALVVIIGTQTVSCASSLLTSSGSDAEPSSAPESEAATEAAETPGEVKEEPKFFLTTKHLDEVSSNRNIVVFIVDRFDVQYYKTAREECPEILYNLEDGFTYFSDAITRYPRTFPSIAYMITGNEYDATRPRKEYYREAYTSSRFLDRLKSHGYRIDLYTDAFYGYDEEEYMDTYASNLSKADGYTVDSRLALAGDMTALSLYRYAPFACKGAFRNLGTDRFNRHVIPDTVCPKYTLDMKAVHRYLTDNPLRIGCKGNRYAFIHISGTHPPFNYDEEFRTLPMDDPKRNDPICSLKQSFRIINRYLDQMRELGVYEDATIVITGDHCNIEDDTKVPLTKPHLTTLLVKPAGATGGGLKVSRAQVSHADLFATLLKSAGLSAKGFGKSVFDIAEDETRTRPYCFHSLQWTRNGKLNYEEVNFEITGPGDDYANWHVVERHATGKSIYD